VQRLHGMVPAREIAESLSAVADVALARLLPVVEEDFARQHGRIAGSALAIVALGKLGSRELTPTSDLDLIFIYTLPENAEGSDGQRSLAPTHYFARLGQRLISALTAQTPEGRLYEVDMRLRPSGHAGPLATSLEAWHKYQSESAWTWEHMALTRARVVAGPQNLRAQIDEMVRQILSRHRDEAKLLRDVYDMRERICKEHRTPVIWDIKYVRGGLVDIEFIAQYLQLRHGPQTAEVLHPSTLEALHRVGEIGGLEIADTLVLCGALDLWHGLQGLLRLFMDRPPSDESEAAFPKTLRDDLVRCADATNFDDLKNRMAVAREGVIDVYDRLIAGPAQAISAQQDSDCEPTKERST
jgi:[glutamine synthetase] adenylyltransferase / [glutamine synthetase]-adenylyl-L-tyrosine phosphorylase